jgi:DNA-binding CsgD family transcriptional regulator
MGARRDLIAVVEACYDLAAAEPDWLRRVADTFHAVLRPTHGLLAYHIDVDERGYRIQSPVQSGETPTKMVERIQVMSGLLDKKRRGEARLFGRAKATLYERVIAAGLREPADVLVKSECRRMGPDWMYTLGAPVADVFFLMNHHIDGNGATGLFGGLAEQRSFRPAERAMFQMLSAHIKAGLRLRRRLPEASRAAAAPDGGAVLTPSGRLLHADGDARDADEARALCESVQRVDHARTQKSGRDEEALAVCHGLIRGRWSLVESFDTDGKRFMIAHKNPEDVRDPRGLTSMESRVVGLAVRGYSDKLIAYHLGSTPGTVSSHLAHALRKLGLRGRVDLVRELGRAYPQAPL